MSAELERPALVPLNTKTRRQIHAIVRLTRTEQGAIRAVETVTTEAMYTALRIKSVQVQLELALPAASPEISMIAAAGCMAITRAVQQFGTSIT